MQSSRGVVLGLKKKCGEKGVGLREGVESRDEGPRGRREDARDKRVLRVFSFAEMRD